jgi:hypothetical protein
LADGIRAYAEGQAQLHRDLAIQFHGLWANFLEGGAVLVPISINDDDIKEPEMEGNEEAELSDEEEEEEGAAIEEDWEFIDKDLLQ